MATKRKTATKKVAKVKSQGGPTNEIVGIVLLGISALYFLALASFDAYDLPAWVRHSPATHPNDPIQNLIGPVGAILAGYSYLFFGIASYLIPIGMIWFGVSKLTSELRIARRTLIGFAIFVLAGASLAQIQPFAFSDWRDHYFSYGPGGVVGHIFGATLLRGTIGGIGAFILLAMAYATGILMMTGMHPVVVVRAIRAGTPDALESLKARWFAFRYPEDIPAPVAKKRVAAKKAKAKPDPVTDEIEDEPELPLDDLPEPKIIDASAPRVAPEGEEKKKTLAELQEELRERKKGKRATNNPSPSLAEAFSDFELPPMDILQFAEPEEQNSNGDDKRELWETQTTIVKTLSTFGVKVSPGDITKGPTITRYEVYPSEGLRVNRITALEQDIARATRAEQINILAPIPGRDTVGIEIANDKKYAVTLRELLEDDAFAKSKAKIPLALGKDVYGKTIVGDLAAMPHLLVSGATGAGKSVCINSIIASLLYRFTPEEMRFIMVDPKVVEMQAYKDLPHLAIPLVTEPKKVLLALRWVVKEMENRYQLFKKIGVKDFGSYNKHQEKAKLERDEQSKLEDTVADDVGVSVESAGNELEDLGFEFGDEPTPLITPTASALGATPGPVELDEVALSAHPVRVNSDGAADYASPPAKNPIDEAPLPDHLPYIVVIIDELADLMDTAPADVEMNIVRIAQMARAAGIHLILATQTPRAEVITGRIRANVPTKIAFRVSSGLESRVILDVKGAERLVGKGDMLYLPPGSSALVRAQGALVTEEEIEDLVSYLTEQAEPVFEAEITETIEGGGDMDDEDVCDEDEETLEKCLEVIGQEGKASASMLQRRLRLGYNRASRMMDIMEDRGIIGPGEGAKPREILIDLSGGLD